ncbi:helix-turn-helix transcriptional regulator [Isoptericola chiayiensis]|uniref:Helix-turn-helix transcriptional regulator n=1 Tax=Isoptericola chiayiensis TaxID=579446 RepID=A0ABP8YEC2_9MICO|nr:helix-turn-helix domain-containing protein [Isoptericola chiayiensis]NOV99912.1 transcriptional regulator with XRE-family HTH domain [Isoptericola chiayiensis]
MDRRALAEFLRRRREALQPAAVGLPPGLRRRAPGLRREEVALLATMSTDYYTRLEQQRGPQPSTDILAALARALRLTDDERDYLFRTAGQPAPPRTVDAGRVAPALQRVLDRLDDTPALILGPLGETLAQNDLARALYGDTDTLRGWERSEIYRWFAHPATARAVYPADDRDRQGRSLVASLRAALGLLGPRSRAAALVDVLTDLSGEFSALWDRQEVAQRFVDHKVLIHPVVGEIEVDCQVLLTEDRLQALLVLTAAPGSDAAERLRLLGVVGTQDLGASAQRPGR